MSLLLNIHLAYNLIYLSYITHQEQLIAVLFKTVKLILSISLITNIVLSLYYLFPNSMTYSNMMFFIEGLSNSTTFDIIKTLILGFLFMYIEVSILEVEYIIILIYLFNFSFEKIRKLDDLKLKVYSAISLFIILFMVYVSIDIITPDWYESSFTNKYNNYKPWVTVINFTIAYTLRWLLWFILIGEIKIKCNINKYSTGPMGFIYSSKDKDYIDRLEKINKFNFYFFIIYFISYTLIFCNISYINLIVSEIYVLFIASLGICKELISLVLNNMFKYSGELYSTFVECGSLTKRWLYNVIEEPVRLIINNLHTIIIEYWLSIIKIMDNNVLYIINLACSDILNICAHHFGVDIYLMDAGNNNPDNNSWDIGFWGGSPNNQPPNVNYFTSGFDDSDSNQYYLDQYLTNPEPFQPSSNYLSTSGESSTQLSLVNNFPNLPVNTFPNFSPDAISNLPTSEIGMTQASNTYTGIESTVSNLATNNNNSNINYRYLSINMANCPVIGSFTIGENNYIITYKPGSDQVLLWSNGECIGTKCSNGTYIGRNILGRKAVFRLPDRRMYVLDLISSQINLVKKIILGLPDKIDNLTIGVETGFRDLTIALYDSDIYGNRALDSYDLYADHHAISIKKNYEAGNKFNIIRHSLAESPNTPYYMQRNHNLDYNSRFNRFPDYIDINGCKECKFDKWSTLEWIRTKEQWIICMIITHNIGFADTNLGVNGGFTPDNIPNYKYFRRIIQEYFENVDKLIDKKICKHDISNNEVLKTHAMRTYIDSNLRGILLWNKSFKILS